MVRVFLSLLVVFAFACGGETQSVSDAVEGAANDVAARAGDAADAARDAASDATDAMMGANDAVAQGCLDLVKKAKFAEAIPECTKALGVDPSNVDVQQALERAKSEAAKASADQAGDAVKGAAGNLLN